MFNSNAIQVFNTGPGGGVGDPTGINEVTQTAETTLLIKGDGATNGSQAKTAVLIDSSGTFPSVAIAGTPAISLSQSPYAAVGYAASFDGTASYYTTSLTGKAAGLGTGYTIEFWIKPRTINSGKCRILDTRQSDDGGGLDIHFQNGQLEIGTSGSWLFNGNATCTIVANTWSHFAVVRGTDNIWRIYWNGTYVSQFGFSNTLTSTSFRVGGLPNAFGTAYLDGYLSNVRVTNDAVYTSNFTPSLTGFSGTNASILLFKDTVSTAIDSSSNAFTITTVGTGSTIVSNAGNISINPVTQGGSLYFDGSGGTVTTPASSNVTLGAQDFTIEGWVYFTSIPGAATGIFQIGDGYFPGTTNNSVALGLLGTSVYQIYANNTYFHSTGTAPVLNTWTHFAVVRSSLVTKLYINGVACITTSDTRTYTSQYLGLGQIYGGYPLNGYIADFNVVNGTALYTSNFTKTSLSALTANTKLQLQFKEQSYNGIYDVTGLNSLNIGASAQISTSVKKYGTGSVYSPGNPSYIVVPASSNFAFAADFSVECWAYPITLNNTMNTILDFRQDGTNSNNITIFATSTKIAVQFAGTEILTYSSTISLNTWYHIAVCRVGPFLALKIDGSLIAYTSNSTSMPGNNIHIVSNAVYANESFNGYIDDLRVSRGKSIYNIVGTNTTPFRYFRTTVLTNNDGSYAEINELRYMVGSTAYPTVDMTSNTTPSPLVASASSSYSGDTSAWGPWHGFSSDASYGWTSTSAVANEWLQIDFGAGNAIVPTGMRITSVMDIGRHPKTFRVEGSNTGTFSGEQTLLYLGSTTWPAVGSQTFTF